MTTLNCSPPIWSQTHVAVQRGSDPPARRLPAWPARRRDAAEIERRCEISPSCKAALDEARGRFTSLQAAPPPSEAPERLIQATVQRIQRAIDHRRRTTRRIMTGLGAALAASVLILLGLTIATDPAGPDSRQHGRPGPAPAPGRHHGVAAHPPHRSHRRQQAPGQRARHHRARRTPRRPVHPAGQPRAPTFSAPPSRVSRRPIGRTASTPWSSRRKRRKVWRSSPRKWS